MTCIKIDWERNLPLGTDKEKVRKAQGLALGLGIGVSLIFLIRYWNYYGQLYGYINGAYGRIDWNHMPPFWELMQGALWGFYLSGALCLFHAILFYYSHYQDSKSIYTMRRLPNRWELWRRCLAIPGLFLALTIGSALILTGVYWLIWRFATPEGCFLIV